MNPAVDNEFQQWLSQINQVCGNFTGRLLTERYTGVLDTHFAKGLSHLLKLKDYYWARSNFVRPSFAQCKGVI